MDVDTRGDAVRLWPTTVNNIDHQPNTHQIPILTSMDMGIHFDPNNSTDLGNGDTNAAITIPYDEAGLFQNALVVGRDDRNHDHDHSLSQCPPSSAESDSNIYPGKDNSSSNHHHHRSQLKKQSLNFKGKTTLAMGYRADCEKCRHKVPGHYSHFIRS